MIAHSNPSAGLPPVITLVIVILLLIIDLRVAMYLINDLYKPERRVNGDKNVWALIIVFGSILGMLAYVLYGREA
ncbi:MAG TPA: hypothetical protein VF807_01210 [Ktedonobacterales bacterium]